MLIKYAPFWVLCLAFLQKQLNSNFIKVSSIEKLIFNIDKLAIKLYNIMQNEVIAVNDKKYLRELAKKHFEIANLPIMQERADMWQRHNDGERKFVPIVLEMNAFEHELMPKLQCEDSICREFETNMLRAIVSHEFIDDDKVVSKYFEVHKVIHYKELNVDFKRTHTSGVGFHIDPIISDLERDFNKIGASKYWYDEERTNKKLELANDILGDIMPVLPINSVINWTVMLTQTVVKLMGTENYFIALADKPEAVKKLFDYLEKDLRGFLVWQEKEGLLTKNNGNDYVGGGTYGFTKQLSDIPMLKNRWASMNSQESVGLSPKMFKEIIFPYFLKMADLFGRIYWGCCEPVHEIWETCLTKIPNLSKVSVSPYSDEKLMGEYLSKSNVIYSRKPRPHFIGFDDVFDEEGYKKHIKYTLDCAKNCNLEIIFRDIYTLKGEQTRGKRAVQILRSLL